MIWLDIIDPKYVLFFHSLIPKLKQLDKILITTRKSEGYNECAKLLEIFDIENIPVGGYGGETLLGKFHSRLQRQEGFLKIFEKTQLPKLFITGASVDGTQTAYGLGIPIIQFSDTPLRDDYFALEKITLLSRLTLPLSSLIFRPFIVPEVCYTSLGIASKNIISYDFIDVALWLNDLKPAKDFREKYAIPTTRPTILVREEEYKAHYVDKKLSVIYESIYLLNTCIDANIVIMPRYESDILKKEFGNLKNVFIIEEKLFPNQFYPFIDILIGGGGTMNLEACYLGIPTISTRSLFLFHDRYLLDNSLMEHFKDPLSLCKAVKNIIALKWNGKNISRSDYKKFFELQKADFNQIFKEITKRFYT
ncbi:DUF354 domain-containing protein [Helicobacter sp. 11S03491-1]|uniref:DUF354 domain-containing protein n=1 Tax=Helicobacter sp. 11S03491-1 TaxID=1476196 RepID=UPI000BA631E8|nr:DUF354 domain-containing protein [Helicobacter sp. 11S03491-1]PAF43018.1 hypothetical protein BKH45_02805 [Helicobacter sp. 11S03491-1]